MIAGLLAGHASLYLALRVVRALRFSTVFAPLTALFLTFCYPPLAVALAAVAAYRLQPDARHRVPAKWFVIGMGLFTLPGTFIALIALVDWAAVSPDTRPFFPFLPLAPECAPALAWGIALAALYWAPPVNPEHTDDIKTSLLNFGKVVTK
jgi:hypothetical protein